MKFLTLEVYNSWYSSYDDDSTLRAAYQQYFRYLEDLQGQLPESVLALARLRGVDDGLVARVEHNRDQGTLHLTLRCGDLGSGYFDLRLRYEDAKLSLEDEEKLAHIAHTTHSHTEHEHDLFFHELDRSADGGIEHRLLFHPGVWFGVRCRVLDWEQVPRPNRELPDVRDRFRMNAQT